MNNRVALLVALTLLAFPAVSPAQTAPLVNQHEVKYVIFMVPDGMGLADVTATRIRKNGIAGEGLALESLDRIGYERTYSEANTITDSSAAASAWACGEKFINNEVCLHADGRPNNPTLLELAKELGWGTGLVATQTITHATPAAFGAHVAARKCEEEIARQYVELSQPDVLLGGGLTKFNGVSVPASGCPASSNLLPEAAANGYTLVTDKASMSSAVATGTSKLIGLFAGGSLTPEYRADIRPAGQPRLPDMTSAALAIMEQHPTGFFLMIEGSLVDSGNHAENIDYQYGEMVAFDESVRLVLDWINARPERKQHTLLLVAPDHETGGFAIEGTETPAGEPLGFFVPAYAFPPVSATFPEAHHTGTDQPIWSSGPGSEPLGKAIDNTFVYTVVKAVMGY
jgi:alkaline phosphatase